MTIDEMKIYDLIYVATPYSKYPMGIEAAWIDACKLTADLMKRGLKVYSPIAHTHPLAIHGGIDPLDHSIWLPFDASMMKKADALLVAMMPTWEKSRGIQEEIVAFLEMNKPVIYLDLETMRLVGP